MRANEFLSEVSKPYEPPPRRGSEEFEKSKQYFISLINQTITNYNQQLANLKKTNFAEYSKKLRDTKSLSKDLQNTIFNTLKTKGGGFILDKDIARFSELFDLQIPQKQEPTPQQPSVEPKNLEPITVGNEKIQPTDPRYNKIMKQTKSESILETYVRFDSKTGTVSLLNKDIRTLADIITQRWYMNRYAKFTNPEKWAQINSSSSDDSFSDNSEQQKILKSITGVDPRDPNFGQTLSNILVDPKKTDELKNKIKVYIPPKKS